ncbi:MAG: glycosyltransferase [Gemmatimonadetes bacterium]|nr:glycosyltransferase [Gemmatimonadota bacterium]
MTAGLDFARGDWVVLLDCDLQDSPRYIPEMYAKATTEKYDIVLARRTVRKHSWLKSASAKVFLRRVQLPT